MNDGPRFESDVRALTAADYGAARRAFIESAREALPLVAVYEYGTVSVPGVSDLDFLLVVDASRLERDGRQGSLWSDGYLIDHPILVTEEQFRRLPYLLHAGSLNRVWGREVSVEAPPEEESAILGAAKLADFGQLLLHALVKLRNHEAISTREALLRLRSVFHSAQLSRDLDASPNPEAERFLEEVDALRRSWLEAPDQQETLGRLLESAPNVVLDLVDRLERVATHRGWWKKRDHERGGVVVQVAESSLTSFVETGVEAGTEGRLSVLSGPRVRLGATKLDFSISQVKLGPYLRDHALLSLSSAGWIARPSDRPEVAPRGTFSEEYRRAVERRMRRGRGHVAWLVKNGLVDMGQVPPYGGVFRQWPGRRGYVEPMLRRMGSKAYAAGVRLLHRAREMQEGDVLVTLRDATTS